jgi:nitrile hydratase accessory protein
MQTDLNLPAIPADDEGPVFREPWEAQAFALAVALNQAGHFTWAEWVDTISGELRHADHDPEATYYSHWLAALEKLVLAKGLTNDADLQLRRIECAANVPGHHDHVARREPVRIA